MIYQYILPFHNGNITIMKPKVYHSKNTIVILYIETLIQIAQI